MPDIPIIDYTEDEYRHIIVGANHSQCGEQIDAYRHCFEDFLGHVATHDTRPVMLYEGSSIPALEETEEDCLRSERGEVSLLFHWAYSNSIPLESFEMSDLNLLDTIYSNDNNPRLSSVYFLMRQHRQWHDMPNRPDFAEYMHQAMGQYRHAAHQLASERGKDVWPQDSFDISRMIQRFELLYDGREFNAHDRDFFLEQISVQSTAQITGVFDRMSRSVSALREQHIQQRIRKYANENKSIFTFIGDWHCPALAASLGRKLITMSPRRPIQVNWQPPVAVQAQLEVPALTHHLYPYKNYLENHTPLLLPIDVLRQTMTYNISRLVLGIDRAVAERPATYKDYYEQFLGDVAASGTSPVVVYDEILGEPGKQAFLKLVERDNLLPTNVPITLLDALEARLVEQYGLRGKMYLTMRNGVMARLRKSKYTTPSAGLRVSLKRRAETKASCAHAELDSRLVSSCHISVHDTQVDELVDFEENFFAEYAPNKRLDEPAYNLPEGLFTAAHDIKMSSFALGLCPPHSLFMLTTRNACRKIDRDDVKTVPVVL